MSTFEKRKLQNYLTLQKMCDIATNIGDIHLLTFAIGVLSLLMLVIFNEYIKKPLTGAIRCPFPIQLIIVILGTIFSFHFKLKERYNVDVIGNIPVG